MRTGRVMCQSGGLTVCWRGLGRGGGGVWRVGGVSGWVGFKKKD